MAQITRCRICRKTLGVGRMLAGKSYCKQHDDEENNLRISNDKHIKITPQGVVGAISEYTVCVDLMRRGYEVFKSISVHCSCDLIIYKDGQAKTVEVKTGYYRIDSPIPMKKHPVQDFKADLLAVVMYDGKIKYTPDL